MIGTSILKKWKAYRKASVESTLRKKGYVPSDELDIPADHIYAIKVSTKSGGCDSRIVYECGEKVYHEKRSPDIIGYDNPHAGSLIYREFEYQGSVYRMAPQGYSGSYEIKVVRPDGKKLNASERNEHFSEPISYYENGTPTEIMPELLSKYKAAESIIMKKYQNAPIINDINPNPWTLPNRAYIYARDNGWMKRVMPAGVS
jgi:hypothetical protein